MLGLLAMVRVRVAYVANAPRYHFDRKFHQNYQKIVVNCIFIRAVSWSIGYLYDDARFAQRARI